MSRRASVGVCLAWALAALPALPVGGQEPLPSPTLLRVERPAWALALERVRRDAAPLVGVAVALPSGSGLDPADRPGAGQVAADAVVDAVETRLGLGNVEGRAAVDPDRTRLTFLVRPDRLGALFDALSDAGFGAGPDLASVESARRRRADVLRFEVDSPVREVDVERRALLYGPGDPRTRPPGGTLEAVEALTDAEVQGARRNLFRSGEARVVVVGPVADAADDASVMAGQAPAVDSSGAPLPTPAASRPSLPAATSAGPAWLTPDRRVVPREVTNTWIAVAFPVPAELPRVAVLFVADRIHQELNAVPPDPGLFSASVSIVEMPEGEVLLVDAAVLPEAADGFEARILALPGQLAAARDPAFFRFHRGRFRAGRLIAGSPPEAAATRMAGELLARGSILDLDDAIWSLTAAMAADAAAALGPPRILVFGPEFGGDGWP